MDKAIRLLRSTVGLKFLFVLFIVCKSQSISQFLV